MNQDPPAASQPHIRAVVFDCFGVLYEDALKEFIEHYASDDAATPRRHYYDLALALDRGLVSDHDFYAELQQLSGEAPEVIQHRLRDVTVLNRSVVDIVASLRPKYRIGMLSNAQRGFLDRFLANHNLGGHFDAVLASSETQFVKPERGIFVEMAKRLGVELPEILFIDDSSENTAAAGSFGMSAIHYQNPAGLRAALSRRLHWEN